MAELEQIFTEKKTNKAQVSLHAAKFFVDFRGVCEKRIANLIDKNIDSILKSQVHYEWTMHTRPSLYLQNIANFLNLTSAELSILSLEGKQRIYQSVLRHVGDALVYLITIKSGKKIGLHFLESFQKDVLFLESFENCLDSSAHID
ncbi:hypothetical protein HDU98_012113 [Podochytrium sp. JEL0797]|nr:hypothetical protein HDU98_012113 [Podochytrium sp. JEL0797]